MHERVRVLYFRPRDTGFAKTVGDLMTPLGSELRTVFLPRPPTRPSDTVMVYTWKEHGAAEPMIVQLMDDRQLPGRWLSVRCASKDRCDAAMRVLDLVLPVVRVDALKRKAKEPGRDPGVLVRMALALEDQRDPGAARLLVAAVRARSVRVRLSAAMALGLLKWEELLPALSRAIERESDEAVRRVMEAARRSTTTEAQ